MIRTARRMGVATVAVYSDADAASMHVAMADEAIHIGASPVSESYLVGSRIIEAALATGAEAIHPGYGFLSENAKFAEALEAALQHDALAGAVVGHRAPAEVSARVATFGCPRPAVPLPRIGQGPTAGFSAEQHQAFAPGVPSHDRLHSRRGRLARAALGPVDTVVFPGFGELTRAGVGIAP